MDPHTSIGHSGKRKEVKAFTFHRIETEEVCEWYITPCFVEGLDAYDGITDLEYEKNLISNEFAVKLRLPYELRKNDERVVSREVLVSLKDGEFEVEEEVVGEEFIQGYKAIREKNDPGVFVLPIRLEGKYDCHALVDTGSNINVMPYRIYESLGRDKVKPISNRITM
ncbi:transposase, Ptta/En/Spm, transposase, Tnp1/En/Spm-like protein [Tanacetum coccineum]